MGVQSREPDESDTVTLTESDGHVVARDDDSGVASQGDTKAEALANLAEALELHERPDPEDAELEEATAPWLTDE
jgi:predicted RNase H-like HicB family nuclease